MKGTRNMPRWWKFTPWKIVRARFLTDEHFHPKLFCRKYGLDAARVARLNEGRQFSFWPALCEALSKETGLSPEFFGNLSRQHHIQPPFAPLAVAQPLGNRGLF